MSEQQTPAQLGFCMPAEWERHNAVWLAWPYDDTTFPGRVPIVEQRFVEIIKAVHASETVELLVLSQAMQDKVRAILASERIDFSKVNFHIVNFADVWTRDYGPTFLVNRREKSLGWVKWDYNGYGKADDPYFGLVVKDNNVFNLVSLPGKKFRPGIVLEGGGIEVNGQGTLITTEQCLLNPNRNPQLNRKQVEQYLKDYLGVAKIVWLKKGLFNDHTDGHIDDIVRFVGPNRIVSAYEDKTSDENFAAMDGNFQVLSNAVDQDGKPFEVIKLPMPHMRYESIHSVHSGIGFENNGPEQAEKAAVSYLNFYIGNAAVLVPIFHDPNDKTALEIIQNCFPDREVVGIDCRDIIYGGGAIHCMTQQQPAIEL